MSDEDRRTPDPDRPGDVAPADLADAATRVFDPNAGPAERETRVLSDEASESERATRVLSGDDEPDVASAATVVATEISGVEGLAATRVIEEEDKTSPPPVAAAAPAVAPPRAAPAAPPRPAAAPKAREEDRGLRPGTILFGEYEIVSVLGAGGMGEVYRARHRRLDEHRAIKVMHAEMSKRRGASEFFYREAKALLAVRHPAVVHCHDLLSDDAGRVYLIMEMIEGIPLSKKLNEGPLSPDDVAILGARVAHGLAAAHRKGVIHRDLSPDNIVLPGGRVQEAKIIDFGIAKLLEQGEGTIVDGFKGKLSYASPEQLGFFGGKIDGRSDLYSLGLVLAASALGRPMVMGTTVMEAVDARRNLKGLPDGIPMGLRSAIQPLLALNPEDRPKYVDRLFVVPGALDSVSESGLYGKPAPKPAGGAWSAGAAAAAPSNRTGLVLGAVGAGAVVIAGLLYLGSMLGGSADSGLTSPAGSATSTASPTQDSPAAAVSEAGVISADAAGGSGSGTATLAAQPAAAGPAANPISASGAASDRAAERDARAAAIAAAAQQEQEKSPAKVARVAPAPAKKSGPSASERIKIVGMLTSAKLALGEGNLMSPPGDNAYDKYRAVLNLDPRNAAARSGLREVASRFVQRAQKDIEKGDKAAAKENLRRARQADASFPGIRATEARLAGS
ncbi:MAG: serine/threonine protein kinase [Deltaproteobacteria bacterium]|nr:serine/threonine protein kinase [Deltaproteobacteria bacterium]